MAWEYYQAIRHVAVTETVSFGHPSPLEITNNLSVSCRIVVPSVPTAPKGIVMRWDNTGTTQSWILCTGFTAGNYAKLRIITSNDGSYDAGNARDYQSTDDLLGVGEHHVVMTFASGTQKAYVDGTEVTSWTKTYDAATTTIYNGSGSVRTGWLVNGGYGDVFDLSIWDTAVLGATEIAQLWAGTAPESASLSGSQRLVGAWLRDRALAYPTIYDRIGSADGIMTGMRPSNIVDSPRVYPPSPPYTRTRATLTATGAQVTWMGASPQADTGMLFHPDTTWDGSGPDPADYEDFVVVR